MSNVADVVIVGGGINGCAAAYYLAKSGVKSFLHPFNAFFCRFFTFEKIAVRVYAICYGICRE